MLGNKKPMIYMGFFAGFSPIVKISSWFLWSFRRSIFLVTAKVTANLQFHCTCLAMISSIANFKICSAYADGPEPNYGLFNPCALHW